MFCSLLPLLGLSALIVPLNDLPSASANERSTLQFLLPNHVVHQFPDPTWLEKVATRSNGDLLITLLITPELWSIDLSIKTGSLVHKFDEYTSCVGMTELGHDIFYVLTGNSSIRTLQSIPGT
jgi:hypothetical protein